MAKKSQSGNYDEESRSVPLALETNAYFLENIFFGSQAHHLAETIPSHSSVIRI
jgi:hypothetical protein